MASKSTGKVDVLDYSKMTVQELKAVLREVGLPASGKKAALVKRVSEAASVYPSPRDISKPKMPILNRITSVVDLKKSLLFAFIAFYSMFVWIGYESVRAKSLTERLREGAAIDVVPKELGEFTLNEFIEMLVIVPGQFMVGTFLVLIVTIIVVYPIAYGITRDAKIFGLLLGLGGILLLIHTINSRVWPAGVFLLYFLGLSLLNFIYIVLILFALFRIVGSLDSIDESLKKKGD